MEWMLLPLRRYAEFTGRSRRMEFWMFQLLNVIVSTVLGLICFAGMPPEFFADVDNIDPTMEFGVLFWVGLGLMTIWGLAILIPSIAVTVRRLHDRNMSGWWYLGFIVASMIPVVGFVALIAWLVIMVLPGTSGENRFGPDPLGQAPAEVFA